MLPVYLDIYKEICPPNLSAFLSLKCSKWWHFPEYLPINWHYHWKRNQINFWLCCASLQILFVLWEGRKINLQNSRLWPFAFCWLSCFPSSPQCLCHSSANGWCKQFSSHANTTPLYLKVKISKNLKNSLSLAKQACAVEAGRGCHNSSGNHTLLYNLWLSPLSTL